MANLEEKVDMLIEKQDKMEGNILEIQQTQMEMLKTQNKMQSSLYDLNEKQNSMKQDIKDLRENQNVIRQDIVKLEKKVDKNHEELTKRLDENLYEISEMFQDVYKYIDRKHRKIAIL